MSVVRAATGGHSTRSRWEAGISRVSVAVRQPTVIDIAGLLAELAKQPLHGGRCRRLRDELGRQLLSGEPGLHHPDVQVRLPRQPAVAPARRVARRPRAA